MKSILIVAPASKDRRERSLGRDDYFGVHFENALLELTRTLEGPSAIGAILVPWRHDTRALIAVAAIDAAPSFDPEESAGSDVRQSRIVPYQAADDEVDLSNDLFWQASHLSLGRTGLPTMSAAIQKYRPSYYIMLGDTPQPDAIGSSVIEHDAKVLTFSSLAQTHQLSSLLGLPRDRIEDLEGRLVRDGAEEADDHESLEADWSAEDELEPFIPFGLLIQEELDGLLFPEEVRRGD